MRVAVGVIFSWQKTPRLSVRKFPQRLMVRLDDIRKRLTRWKCDEVEEGGNVVGHQLLSNRTSLPL